MEFLSSNFHLPILNFLTSIFYLLKSKSYICLLFLFEMLQKETQLAVEKGEMLPLMEEAESLM
jgi:hypothetical protein